MGSAVATDDNNRLGWRDASAIGDIDDKMGTASWEVDGWTVHGDVCADGSIVCRVGVGSAVAPGDNQMLGWRDTSALGENMGEKEGTASWEADGWRVHGDVCAVGSMVCKARVGSAVAPGDNHRLGCRDA